MGTEVRGSKLRNESTAKDKSTGISKKCRTEWVTSWDGGSSSTQSKGLSQNHWVGFLTIRRSVDLINVKDGESTMQISSFRLKKIVCKLWMSSWRSGSNLRMYLSLRLPTLRRSKLNWKKNARNFWLLIGN